MMMVVTWQRCVRVPFVSCTLTFTVFHIHSFCGSFLAQSAQQHAWLQGFLIGCSAESRGRSRLRLAPEPCQPRILCVSNMTFNATIAWAMAPTEESCVESFSQGPRRADGSL